MQFFIDVCGIKRTLMCSKSSFLLYSCGAQSSPNPAALMSQWRGAFISGNKEAIQTQGCFKTRSETSPGSGEACAPAFVYLQVTAASIQSDFYFKPVFTSSHPPLPVSLPSHYTPPPSPPLSRGDRCQRRAASCHRAMWRVLWRSPLS